MEQSFHDLIEERYPEFDAFERAMLRNDALYLPKIIGNFKYKYYTNTTIMGKIHQKLPNHSTSKLTDLIVRDDPAFVDELLTIAYTGYDHPKISNSLIALQFAVSLNLIFIHNAENITERMMRSPMCRELIKQLIENNTEFINPAGTFGLFKNLRVDSLIFTILFDEDTLITDAVKNMKRNKESYTGSIDSSKKTSMDLYPDEQLTNDELLYTGFVYGAILRRSSDELSILFDRDYHTTIRAMKYVLNRVPKTRPDEQFLKLSMHGIEYQSWKKSSENMINSLLHEPVGNYITITHAFNPRMKLSKPKELFIAMWPDHELAQSLVVNSLSHDDPIREAFASNNIGKSIAEKHLFKVDNSEARPAIQNDDFEKLYSCLDITQKHILQDQIEEMLPLIFYYKADKCLRGIMYASEISKALHNLMLDGGKLCGVHTNYLYGAVEDTFDELSSPEKMMFNFLLAAAYSIEMFTTLYRHDNALNDIHEESNDFAFPKTRYALTLGAILTLNVDFYNWIIRELYSGNEDEFIAELYLRSQLARDEYDSRNHFMINAFDAFRYYMRLLEYQ